MEAPPPTLFRREALGPAASARSEGELLRIPYAWTAWTYWMLVVLAVAAALFAALGRVHEYAAGAAVVRLDGRTEVLASSGLIVASIEVHPGQRVAPGDVLLRYYLTLEVDELQRSTPQFQLPVAGDRGGGRPDEARAGARALQAQTDVAEARLVLRVVRAAQVGTVSEVIVRAGQHVAAGEALLSVVRDEARFSVVGVLPGHYRPLLRAGMTLRLSLAGYAYRRLSLVIHSVGNRVLGPTEIRRSLGLAASEAVPVQGPAILVRARLGDRTFRADGGSLRFHDGMAGTIETAVRRERILVMLVPGLRALFGGER
jgi:biotin carboxyl carrier protein